MKTEGLAGLDAGGGTSGPLYVARVVHTTTEINKVLPTQGWNIQSSRTQYEDRML